MAGERDAIERTALNLALMAWLNDHIYDGVDAESFVRRHLLFTMRRTDGAVRYDRLVMKADWR